MVYKAIRDLVLYGLEKDLIQWCDQVFVTNALLSALELEEYKEPQGERDTDLEKILKVLLDYALEKALIEDNVVDRDLFDTKLMGILTPFPREVIKQFFHFYKESPKQATDWFYEFNQNTDYIRRYRIQKDCRWKTPTPYGDLDITINLSKPEKDPKAIAAAKNTPPTGYPKCMLCKENEGYSGRVNHPARQNHRMIPIEMGGNPWFFQYSPYVYYNEHCIVLSGEHLPMKIDRDTFKKMFDFIGFLPHYFVGSNADLPIVGGSILSHDHFQGGKYTFAMASAVIEKNIDFQGFSDVEGGIVKWPMSVIRLRSENVGSVVELAVRILESWRGYTDEEAFIFAKTNSEPHNTITPIARKCLDKYELDLVLRNNITTKEHPLGVYHPHENLHHIKKENIGLIEVMGLAVLPARLLKEMEILKEILLKKADIHLDGRIRIHGPWAEEINKKYHNLTSENIDFILQNEIGLVFARVLEDAGVFKTTAQGRKFFLRFVESCGGRVV
ncbi:UDP-glucose--hexose-1-phosphate uridylyltransferase [Anaerotignum sp. MB30-C6]|uniref:UDP-glucose--hexose-1-phosphate uridylyltransferase n=1 Tax=Anaerotignum sp. MB30-C6 TaxID=3070814 RepID=UPI0027DC4663|nr:UDP-glucose--hexose-1-phosphate uridylyltransferase [Anaerotignum sp. MB30-C6]WMI80985.1 UDP-glucose--hexose-1-phosphate uridylyltransferase [Anaerotignum sp. MB30-C6]